MSLSPGRIFQFGEFQLDVSARSLRRGKKVVPVNSRAFDVLLYLVQNSGNVLTREELLKNVWAESFVDENSLAQSISGLRRALDEKPGDNNFIVTLPGRGYQFVSPVRVLVAPEDETILEEAAAKPDVGAGGLIFQKHTIQTSVVTTNEEKEQLSLPVSRNRSTRLFAVLVFVAISVAGFYSWRKLHPTPLPTNSAAMTTLGAPAPARRSVAVLGFRNLSGRPEEGWISTALAEMLSTELEAGEKLRLVSGEDVARTRLDLPWADADSLSRATLAQLHKNLDSDLIVLGSYTALGEKPGNRIRLDVRLQDTVAGETIADVAVVGGEADLFDMVSQAGSQLRAKLGVEAVSPVEGVSVRASFPSNRDAARLYSEGLARLRVLDATEARDLLQQAIAADPKFALAHSALAEAWSRLGYSKKAQQEGRQAYELSVNLSREDRLVVEGRDRYVGHEYEKAIEIYRALFTLFPDNADYGLRLARMQTRSGKGHDAVATIELLRKLPAPASEDPRIDLVEEEAWTLLGDPKRREQILARAAEKAKAQGSRLILADSRQRQCLLSGSVSACREARDIYAAAGDRDHEAGTLNTWAIAISQTDALEAIRLYQQAGSTFRSNGSEARLADVLDNLGLIYEAQGDPATAEKMTREAIAIMRRVDDKRNMDIAIGNLAGDRLDQGDLRGAIQLNEESLQGWPPEDTGYLALVGLNIAAIHQLQGDLAGARQGFERSLEMWQKKDDQGGMSYATSGLGGLLLQEADFSGARKMYEQALVIRTSRGDKIPIAETQLGLADVSLEEGRSPAEQEAMVRQALEVFQTQKLRDDETLAWGVLARNLLMQGKPAAAKDAMQHARALAAKSQNPNIRWSNAITASRIEIAEKDFAHSAAADTARKELATIITKSRDLGYVGIELDARLALAEIEMKSGQTTAGRAHLAAVEADAKAKGYNLIARKAAIART
jgi:DNA-binding winged helix-turn-helix (wHTH) protein/tetratricopeptide (TPR) repeat protein